MAHFYSNSYPAMPMRQVHTSPMEDVIVQQVEWYMGKLNLPNDEYLKQQMDDQLWVSLDIILEFPKMKRIGVNDKHRVASLLHSCSKILEVDEKSCRIRPAWACNSSLALHDLPPNVRVEQILSLFQDPNLSSAATTSNPPTSVQPLSDTSWLAIFDYPSGAKTFLTIINEKSINGHKIIPEIISDGLNVSPSADLYNRQSSQHQQQQQQPSVYIPSSRPISHNLQIPQEHAHISHAAAPFPTHPGATAPIFSSPMMNVLPLQMPPILHHPHHPHVTTPPSDLHASYPPPPQSTYNPNGNQQPTHSPPQQHQQQPPTQAFIPHSYAPAAHSMPMPRPFMGARPIPPTPTYIVPYQTPHFDPAAAAAAAAAHVSVQPSQMSTTPQVTQIPHQATPHTPPTQHSIPAVSPGQSIGHITAVTATVGTDNAGSGGSGGSGNNSKDSTTNNNINNTHFSNGSNNNNNGGASVSSSMPVVSAGAGTSGTSHHSNGKYNTSNGFIGSVNDSRTTKSSSGSSGGARASSPSTNNSNYINNNGNTNSSTSTIRSLDGLSGLPVSVEVTTPNVENVQLASTATGNSRSNHNKNNHQNRNNRTGDRLSTLNYSNHSGNVATGKRPLSESRVNSQRGNQGDNTVSGSPNPQLGNNHHYSRTTNSGTTPNGHYQAQQSGTNMNGNGGGHVHNSQISHHGRNHYHHHNGNGGSWNGSMYVGRDRYSGRNNGDVGMRYNSNNNNQHHNHYGNQGHHHGHHSHHHHHHHHNNSNSSNNNDISNSNTGGSSSHHHHHHNGAVGRGPGTSLDANERNGFTNGGQIHHRKAKKGGRGHQQNRQSRNHYDRYSNDSRSRTDVRDTRSEATPSRIESPAAKIEDSKTVVSSSINHQEGDARSKKIEPNLGVMDFPPLRATDGKRSGQRLGDGSDDTSKQMLMSTPVAVSNGSTSIPSTTISSPTSSATTSVTVASTESPKGSSNGHLKMEKIGVGEDHSKAVDVGNTESINNDHQKKMDISTRNENSEEVKIKNTKLSNGVIGGGNGIERSGSGSITRGMEKRLDGGGNKTKNGGSNGNGTNGSGMSYAAILRSKKPSSKVKVDGNDNKANVNGISGVNSKGLSASQSVDKSKTKAEAERSTSAVQLKMNVEVGSKIGERDSLDGDAKAENCADKTEIVLEKKDMEENPGEATEVVKDAAPGGHLNVGSTAGKLTREKVAVIASAGVGNDASQNCSGQSNSVWTKKPKSVFEAAAKEDVGGGWMPVPKSRATATSTP